MRKTKKIIILLLLIVIAVVDTYANPVQKIRIRVRFSYHCEGGFGFCPSIEPAKVILSESDAIPEAYYDGRSLVLEIDIGEISEKLSAELSNNEYVPIESDIEISNDLTEQLNLPPGASIAAGRYPIVRNSVGWQIILSILK